MTFGRERYVFLSVPSLARKRKKAKTLSSLSLSLSLFHTKKRKKNGSLAPQLSIFFFLQLPSTSTARKTIEGYLRSAKERTHLGATRAQGGRRRDGREKQKLAPTGRVAESYPRHFFSKRPQLFPSVTVGKLRLRPVSLAMIAAYIMERRWLAKPLQT